MSSLNERSVSLSGHSRRFEGPLHLLLIAFHYMRINLGRRYIRVPHQFLSDSNIRSGLRQGGSQTVPKRVTVDLFRDTCLTNRPLNGLLRSLSNR